MSIRSALAYTFSTRYFCVALQFFATITLARLLTPEEIGIFSVGAAVIMIAHTLRDFGTSTYVIQEQALTQARIGTAFTLTVLVAWILALALWFASTPIAIFYKVVGVGDVMKVMVLNFALIPFGSISMALLRREMNFRAIMIVTVFSTFVHSGSSVLFAAMGYGFISLAWGGVCGTLATVFGALIANPAGFILRPSISELRHVLKFSLRSSISSIASEAGHSAPDIVLGRTVGMEGAGLFSRAMGYVQLFERLLQDVIRSVMLPYLSELERAGEDTREKIMQVLDHIVSISFFMIGLTAILAEPLIALLFGVQWAAAVPLAQMLCVAMLLRCVAPTLAAALVANGKITLVMYNSLIATAIKFLCIGISSHYGLMAGAIGFVVAEVINLFSLLYFSNRSGVFNFGSYVFIVVKNISVAIMGLLPALVVVYFVMVPEEMPKLVAYVFVSGVSSVSLWLVGLIVFDRAPKEEFMRIFMIVRRKLCCW